MKEQIDILNGPKRIKEKVSVKIIHGDDSEESVQVAEESESAEAKKRPDGEAV